MALSYQFTHYLTTNTRAAEIHNFFKNCKNTFMPQCSWCHEGVPGGFNKDIKRHYFPMERTLWVFGHITMWSVMAEWWSLKDSVSGVWSNGDDVYGGEDYEEQVRAPDGIQNIIFTPQLMNTWGSIPHSMLPYCYVITCITHIAVLITMLPVYLWYLTTC